MRLRSFLKKFNKSKSKQIIGDHSYSLLKYTADNGSKEIIWNGTNLKPPSYVLSKDKKYKLYFDSNFSKSYPNYIPKLGERYFTYKSAEEYIKERKPVLELYWKNNYLDCQEIYSSYEEYFAIACNSMNKNRIILKVKNK